jgi:hypothetical protein
LSRSWESTTDLIYQVQYFVYLGYFEYLLLVDCLLKLDYLVYLGYELSSNYLS